MKAFLFAIVLALSAGTAQAQFSARDIRGADEATIYRSKELRRLDRDLNRAYQRAMNSSTMRGARRLQGEQRLWLNRRSRCGISEGCLVRMYERRIDQLEAR